MKIKQLVLSVTAAIVIVGGAKNNKNDKKFT